MPAEIGEDNTVDAISGQLQRLLDILEEDPGMDPNRVSPATAHSAHHFEGVQHAFEEVERQRGLQADLPKEDARETSLRIRSGDERRDLGRMKEKSCSTYLNTMTVATANVRTLHPKEESESRSRFGRTLMIGTVELLETAMHDAAIDVVGLQETRSRQAGIFHGRSYRVVDRCRHLGTIVVANGNDVPNTPSSCEKREGSIRTAGVAHFRVGYIPTSLKLSLYMSMVESHNSFAMHIAPPSFNAFRIVASVYNRALHRIAGAPRFERDEHALSDLDIRRTLKVPSYDCIMMRGRLRYMGRIIRTRPTTLMAMLSIQSSEPHATPEWVLRVQEDLHFAWKTVALLASAPPPDLEAPFWIGVMRDNGRWAQRVKYVHFFESAVDGRAAAKRTAAATPKGLMGTERSGANALTIQAFVLCAKRLFAREFVF